VEPLDLAEVFVTFLALLGPQKVLLSFGQVARETEPATSRRLAVLAGLSAAVIGVAFAEAAPWLTRFFHVSGGSVELEGGIILFVYAAALVLGIHLGADPPHDEDADPTHPLISGYRELLIPFVVSPLGLTAVLVQALSSGSWGWRGTVAAAYAAVCILDLVCMLVLAGVMRYVQATVLDVLSRLLGLLLAGVGVELVLDGLTTLGLLHAHAGH
jgi:multiple antibiotic resistance protein